MIENGLIPVYKTEKGNKAVDARELHEFLEVGKDFSTWIKDRLQKYDFVENVDYIKLTNSGEFINTGLQGRIDYVLKLDAAKEIAMVENNEKGRQARKYFIEVEKRYQEVKQSSEFMIPQTLPEALRLAADLAEENQKLLPKAESFDKFISGENLQDMSTTAKVLGWGRNKLFARLRNDKIFRADNTPYQTYIDRGYFKVKETPVIVSGEVLNKPQTYVTAKGVDWLSKILNV